MSGLPNFDGYIHVTINPNTALMVHFKGLQAYVKLIISPASSLTNFAFFWFKYPGLGPRNLWISWRIAKYLSGRRRMWCVHAYICIFSLLFLFLLLFFPLLLLIATFVPRWFGKLIFYHLDPTLAWDPSSTWLYLSKSTFLQEPRVGRTQPPITSTVLI